MRKADQWKLRTIKSRGRTYQYLELGAKRIPVHGEPGTQEFEVEIERIKSEAARPPVVTVADLTFAFRKSDVFHRLADTTQRQWRPWLDRIADELGTFRIGVFDDTKSIRLIRKWQSRRRSTPRTADYGVQVLSRLLSFARQEGLIQEHHCADVERLYRGDRSHIIWSDDEEERFRLSSPQHVRNAFDLASLTGLRQSDLLNLRWSNVKDDCIQVRTKKSKSFVEIPLYPALAEFLSSLPRSSDHVLNTIRGTPWKSGFSASWNKALKASGVQGKTFHDVRGTAATRLHDAGLSLEDITLLLGWSHKHADKVIKRYISRKSQFAVLKDRMQIALGGTSQPRQP